MPETDAWILPPRNPATAAVRLERHTLCERAILALRRSGIERIAISDECRMGVAGLRRLARHGIAVMTRQSASDAPADRRRVVIVSSDVMFEPSAVGALVERLSSAVAGAVAAAEASPGTFVALTPEAATRLDRRSTDREILRRLDAVRVASLGDRFCRAIIRRRDAPGVERSYISHVHRFDGMTKRLVRLLGAPFEGLLFRLRGRDAG